MKAEELLELRKLPVGAQLGVLIGGLLHHWFDLTVWHVELPEACSVCGLLGALLWKYVDIVLVQPFIIPWVRKRELKSRLLECAKLHSKRGRLLAVHRWQEIVQKIILEYFLPSKKAEKEE